MGERNTCTTAWRTKKCRVHPLRKVYFPSARPSVGRHCRTVWPMLLQNAKIVKSCAAKSSKTGGIAPNYHCAPTAVLPGKVTSHPLFHRPTITGLDKAAIANDICRIYPLPREKRYLCGLHKRNMPYCSSRLLDLQKTCVLGVLKCSHCLR